MVLRIDQMNSPSTSRSGVAIRVLIIEAAKSAVLASRFEESKSRLIAVASPAVLAKERPRIPAISHISSKIPQITHHMMDWQRWRAGATGKAILLKSTVNCFLELLKPVLLAVSYTHLTLPTNREV